MKKSNFFINLAQNLASHRRTGRTNVFINGIEKLLSDMPDLEKVYIITSKMYFGKQIAARLNSIDNRNINRVFAIDINSHIIGAERSHAVVLEHTAVESLLLEAGRALELLETQKSILEKENKKLHEILIKNNISF